MGRGPLIILSGPSGSGKTTLVRRVLANNDLCVRVAVTATTRQPRVGEVDGASYHFWSRERFAQAIEADELLEWAEVHGQYYGTPRSEVEPHRERGWGVLLVIDVQGAAKVRQRCPDARSIFLRGPSWAAYEQRLRDRGTDDEAGIARRLETARRELRHEGDYDHVVINDDLEIASAELRDWIVARLPSKGGDCD